MGHAPSAACDVRMGVDGEDATRHARLYIEPTIRKATEVVMGIARSGLGTLPGRATMMGEAI